MTVLRQKLLRYLACLVRGYEAELMFDARAQRTELLRRFYRGVARRRT
jgi:hypothetical protein